METLHQETIPAEQNDHSGVLFGVGTEAFKDLLTPMPQIGNQPGRGLSALRILWVVMAHDRAG